MHKLCVWLSEPCGIKYLDMSHDPRVDSDVGSARVTWVLSGGNGLRPLWSELSEP